jgi:hypothetical protein
MTDEECSRLTYLVKVMMVPVSWKLDLGQGKVLFHGMYGILCKPQLQFGLIVQILFCKKKKSKPTMLQRTWRMIVLDCVEKIVNLK